MNNEQGAMNNPGYEKAYAFAVRVVKACQWLQAEKREFVLSRQLLRSGTSIGANLAEAHGAISTADLSAKVSIAYKESQETKYWLSLLKDTDYLTPAMHQSLHADADEIAAILYATLKTTRLQK